MVLQEAIRQPDVVAQTTGSPSRGNFGSIFFDSLDMEFDWLFIQSFCLLNRFAHSSASRKIKDKRAVSLVAFFDNQSVTLWDVPDGTTSPGKDAFLGLDLVGPEKLPHSYRVDCD
jgi:hypothetical protein